MAPETVLKTYYDDVYYRLVNAEDDKSSELLQKEMQIVIGTMQDSKEVDEAEAAAEQEDEQWYQEELKKLEKQLKSSPNPNLIDTGKDKEIIEVEDTPPIFDEDDE
jgi:phosphoribosylaminoimidazole carboxylase (NCAIR synthetase)